MFVLIKLVIDRLNYYIKDSLSNIMATLGAPLLHNFNKTLVLFQVNLTSSVSVY